MLHLCKKEKKRKENQHSEFNRFFPESTVVRKREGQGPDALFCCELLSFSFSFFHLKPGAAACWVWKSCCSKQTFKILGTERQVNNSPRSIWIPALMSRGRCEVTEVTARKSEKNKSSISSALCLKRRPDRYRLRRDNQWWEFFAHPMWQTQLRDVFSQS